MYVSPTMGQCVFGSREMPMLLRLLAAARVSDPAVLAWRLGAMQTISRALAGNIDHWQRLPEAAENRDVQVGQTGLERLVSQVLATPELRAAGKTIIEECGRRLAALIERAGPRCATPAQVARSQEGRQ